MSGALAAALRARLTAPVHVVPAGDERWCTDFGRVRRGVPQVVVETRSEEDVAAVLVLARAHGVPVTVRGAGHSCNGRTVSDGGVLLVHAARDAAPVVLGDDGRAEIAASAYWRDVERALNRAGRSVPVLADYLDLTVGGTLSVGCYGVDSVRHGAQVHHVERLRLVRPDGSVSWCSPADDPELFAASLAGLGGVGVISRVVMRTEPHHPVTALHVHRHASLVELAEAAGAVAEHGASGPGMYKALAARGRFVTTVGATYDRWREALAAPAPLRLDARRRPRRLVAFRYRYWRSMTVSLWLRCFPGHRRVWADYVVDATALRPLLAELDRRALSVPEFARTLKSLYVLAIRRRHAVPPLPLEAGGAGSSPLAFGVGLYCMVPPGDDVGLGRVHAVLADCLACCIGLGGRPYLYGAHALDRETGSLLYGEGLERVRTIKRTLDPGDGFQPGALP